MLVYALCRQFTHFLWSNPPVCQNWGAGGRGASSQFWQCQDFESAFYRNPSLTEQVAFTERITLTERMTLTPECMDLTERMALTDLKISNGTFSQGEPLLFSMVSRYFL